MSDHDHIVITRCSPRPKQNKEKARTNRLFKKTDWGNITRFLNNTEDTPQKQTQWTTTSSLSWLMPWRSFHTLKKTSCRYDLLWITRPVKCLIRQTQGAYNRAKKFAKDRDWAKFQRKRKDCQKAQKEAHWNYLNQLLEEDSDRILWRHLKGLRRDMCGVSTLATDGRTGTDPKDKAEMLNGQFSSVFTREDRFNIPTMTTSPHLKMPPFVSVPYYF